MNSHKEKAKELLDRFHDCRVIDFYAAIDCAIVCVKEILAASPSLPIVSDNGSYSSDISENKEYWTEVLTELNNLKK